MVKTKTRIKVAVLCAILLVVLVEVLSSCGGSERETQNVEEEWYAVFIECSDSETMEKIADWQENGMDWYWRYWTGKTNKKTGQLIEEGKDRNWFMTEFDKLSADTLKEISDFFRIEPDDLKRIIKGGYDFTSDNFDLKKFLHAVGAANKVLDYIYGEDVQGVEHSWLFYTKNW